MIENKMAATCAHRRFTSKFFGLLLAWMAVLAFMPCSANSASLLQSKTDATIGSDVDLEKFEVHPQLEFSLYASEPLLVNPTNIDVDHLGRVWVCEVVNYRNKIANGDSLERADGDRILILQDTDDDGVAEDSIVFHQGKDIDSAHGICVLGNRAIVSAGSEVFYLIDTDGDWRADKKELLFTNIKGVQHDHGIHALVFGPDGKLYFNFGNNGRQLCDAEGNPVVDLAGNIVNDQRKPYQQGMVFRCDLDGSNVETLAWNFRNSWEVCVDSFGAIWQSDNDDDGNRGTRINYVFPFGNHGYKDEFSGAAWRKLRSGQAKQIPRRHWHQNDPGVVPNMLNTGAGSPTGICLYEGKQLPELLHNQLIHCDAGPSVVRAYPMTRKKNAAGYDANIVNLLNGTQQNQWFRPTDVCVAPDGSLLVSDWHDSGVGGHRMTDIQGGRIYRIRNRDKSHSKAIATDVTKVQGAIAALVSPNVATRYLGHQALIEFGGRALPELQTLLKSQELHLQARAYWVIDAIESRLHPERTVMIEAWKTGHSELRQMALRWSRAEENQERADRFWDAVGVEDIETLSVAMEMAICLSPKQRREWDEDEHAQRWAKLATKYRSGDRWFLEALGIGAEGNWDRCLDTLLSANTDWQQDENIREIVWRSRGKRSSNLMADLLQTGKIETQRVANYFRAIDLQTSKVSSERLIGMAFGKPPATESDRIVAFESIKRIVPSSLSPDNRKQLNSMLDDFRGTSRFVELVARFKMEDRYPELFELITGDSLQLAVDSIQTLAEQNQLAMFERWIETDQQPRFDNLMNSIRASGNGQLASMLGSYALDPEQSIERRKSAVLVMGTNYQGCGLLSSWVKEKSLDEDFSPAIASALHSSPWIKFQELALQHFPLTTGKSKVPIPKMAELKKLKGDIEVGQTVFNKQGTCSQCHVVKGSGKSIGPDLSEIGSKLTRQAMLESILFPSAGISHNYENWTVLTEAGSLISGMLTSETDNELQIRDKDNILHKINVDEVSSKKKSRLSMMPANLHEQLTPEQLVDLVEYLMSLKKNE